MFVCWCRLWSEQMDSDEQEARLDANVAASVSGFEIVGVDLKPLERFLLIPLKPSLGQFVLSHEELTAYLQYVHQLSWQPVRLRGG